FAGKQAGLSRPLLSVETSPEKHCAGESGQANQAAIRNGIAQADRAGVRPRSFHAVLIAADENCRSGSKRRQPERILYAKVERTCPDCFLVIRQAQKSTLYCDRTWLPARFRFRLWHYLRVRWSGT